MPTFRRFGPLLDTLDSILSQDYPDFELLVVDQNEQWPTEILRRRDSIQADKRVKWLVRQPGVVAARNEAVMQSRGQILLFVDDDVIIKEKTFIRQHVLNYQNPMISAIAGREWNVACREGYDVAIQMTIDAADTLPANAPRWQPALPLAQVLGFGRDDPCRYEICTFSTCNGSIRRDAFLAVGGFDENFRGNSYGDDYDLALRLNSRGFTIVYDPKAQLVHLQSPTGGLRLSDSRNTFSEVSKSVCCWVFFLRHARRGFLRTLLYSHVLRKTVLLRRNVVHPWRQLWVFPCLMIALIEAIVRVRRGPVSRFTKTLTERIA